MRALPVLLLLCACGGSVAVTAETARVAACEQSEAHIEERFNEGEIERDAALQRIDCVRLVCDAMSERLTAGVEAD